MIKYLVSNVSNRMMVRNGTPLFPRRLSRNRHRTTASGGGGLHWIGNKNKRLSLLKLSLRRKSLNPRFFTETQERKMFEILDQSVKTKQRYTDYRDVLTTGSVRGCFWENICIGGIKVKLAKSWREWETQGERVKKKSQGSEAPAIYRAISPLEETARFVTPRLFFDACVVRVFVIVF